MRRRLGRPSVQDVPAVGAAEGPGPQRSDRSRRRLSRPGAERDRSGVGPGSVLVSVEELAYGAEILDIAPAIGAADKVAKETFAIAVAQGPVDER